jgi:hypothetical protein
MPRACPRRAWHALHLLALGGLLVLLGSTVGAQPSFTLKQAQFASRDSAAPPAEADAAWQATELPHVWNTAEQRARGGWYRLHFSLAQPPDKVLAVYLPQVHVNAAV